MMQPEPKKQDGALMYCDGMAGFCVPINVSPSDEQCSAENPRTGTWSRLRLSLKREAAVLLRGVGSCFRLTGIH